ncbi:transporter substrate-binding domain-containing protein [Suttonella ornithocola]|uniref:Glutamine-binding periplasmic protein n=1 Tax=Suttonella ornithocola TaxID=279832 RepID=A0A380MVV2_9GAMM|nr:transporter substrate-binding domain-containing protein [Suttonella ornithocola]SUO96043.1 Glutamine-binding periplasmic protein precursor [Suttonella ornithocola]
MKNKLTQSILVIALSIGNSYAKETYKVMTESNFIPFVYLDEQKKLTGFDIDILNAIAKVEEINFEYKSTIWIQLFKAIEENDADIITAGITITEERKKIVDFTQPYFTSEQKVFARSGYSEKKLEDLRNSSIILKKDTTSDNLIKSLDFVNISYDDTTFKLIKKVLGGEYAATITDSGVVDYYYNRYKSYRPTIFSIPNTTEYYGFWVNKNKKELLNKLNNGLKIIKENGQYKEIYNKYFSNQNTGN